MKVKLALHPQSPKRKVHSESFEVLFFSSIYKERLNKNMFYGFIKTERLKAFRREPINGL